MTDISLPAARHVWQRIDKAWLALVVILALVAMLDWSQFWPTVTFGAGALWHTAPFITFAVLAVAYMKATGAETLLAKAFEGRQVKMIVLAALLGGLSPFCSCEVIPFIAAMLALGAPLGAVMAFWLASPLMDPAMFLITSGTLGWDFAVAKTLAAVGLGLFGGFVTMAAAGSAVFADPLREKPQIGGCCGVKKPFEGKPVWRFWHDTERRDAFKASALENAVFLLKWLALAYVIEALMLEYIPADMVARVLGGDGVGTIILGGIGGRAGVSERLCRCAAGGCAAGTGDERWRGDELCHRGRRQLYPRRHCGLGAGQTAGLCRLSGPGGDRRGAGGAGLAGRRVNQRTVLAPGCAPIVPRGRMALS